MDDVTARFTELSKLVPIPYPWDTQEYIARVAEFRGRAIELVPIAPGALSGTGCGTGSGLWVELVDHDVIMYGAETAQHADHIVAHEVGHMLLGHGLGAPAGHTDDLPLSALMPSLSAEAIRSVLRRQDYSNERERAAEIFADMVMVEATLPKRTPSRLRSTFFRAAHR
ncbi:hypothetical protein IU501_32765 [Nocardia otitidiscaviarum]|uniref:hypothetical protein n=1 Tax=Nocardia otitidiscaviarum TaxID=1823 RepID=UPI0004A704C7|nr:hypothetical protein [Nocardia otitidiscaviarum]MBF6137744.1 hypothetical protein [Nocardia otitidiscaviarum]MBF6485265.1 hypothetical protein [Nocardia otitidiscaviarum]